MEHIDPNIRHTGGCGIKLIDSEGKEIMAHVSLEDQPLSCFVETAMIEKKIKAFGYNITVFNSKDCKMTVKLEPATKISSWPFY